MDNSLRDFLHEIYQNVKKEKIISNGLIRRKKGHTKDVAYLDYCHEGRSTAGFYLLGMLSGNLDEKEGVEILTSIQSLQITDKDNPHYGCFRWYREETEVNDTNAAFFILMPLVILRKFYKELIPQSHLEILDEMLNKSVNWFYKECHDPILYYPNKIISDGALLLAISSILKNQEFYQEGITFFERWNEYTDRRGWGWGENTSVTYSNIILNSLKVASDVVCDEKLKMSLKEKIDSLLDYIKFHNGYEFVPTIRSYNFAGKTHPESPIWYLAGVKNNIKKVLRNSDKILGWLNTLIVFQDDIDFTNNRVGDNKLFASELPVPRVRKERVFDDALAYTWIGKKGRMGSLNRLPVIPGCYQWPTWGLGWQSFPASFIVNDEQVSYLRWFVQEQGNIRTHPANDKGKSYLNPALFGENYYPEVLTYCSQKDNAMIVLRCLVGVNNVACEIADEWIIHRYEHKFEIVKLDSKREWVLLQYPETTVAITALKGIPYKERERIQMKINVVEEENKLSLRQVLYRGEEKTVQHPEMETGWIIYFLEDKYSASIQNHLNQVKITDRSYQDHEVPREQYQEIREISFKVEDEGEELKLRHDPYER